MACHYFSKIVYFDTISVEGLKSKIFYLFPNCVLPSKNVKYIFLTIYDSICQFSMPAHYLSVQMQIITLIVNRQMGILQCFCMKVCSSP